MKRILFSHSYFLRFDQKQWDTGQPYAPLGTLYAAAVLREKGYKVSLFDSMFAWSPEELNASLETVRPDIFVIYDDGFNYLTKMCLTNMREAAFRMIKIAKGKGCIVIVSSSDSTDHYAQYLQQGADFVIIGEAELTLAELANALSNEGGDFLAIGGLAFSRDGENLKTPRRSLIRDLDALPMPAWDLVDFRPYQNMWTKKHGYFSMNMATTRGCPFKCNWCAKPIYGNRYHARSPEHVVKELKYLKASFHVDHIWFCDDIFGLRPGWISEFADILESEELRIRFKIQARADLLLHDGVIESLARAGCENVWIGAESGSQKILDAMDKGITVEQIGRATAQLKRAGIHPSFFIQFGYLGETREDISRTIQMIHDLLPFEIGISVSYPLPGTIFYEKVKKDLKEKSNWTDSDELQMMFKNTYQPGFYKQLHRYVHKSYRRQLALQNIKNICRRPWSITSASIKTAASFVYFLPAAIIARQKLNALEKTFS
ncbi:MAG: B12-binding domain-containing radical SAM protein [Chitinophagales bacterium]